MDEPHFSPEFFSFEAEQFPEVIPEIVPDVAGQDDTLAERMAFPQRGKDDSPKEKSFLETLEKVTDSYGFGLLISVVVHLLLFVLLALMIMKLNETRWGDPIGAGFSDDEAESLVDSIGEMDLDDTAANFEIETPIPQIPDSSLQIDHEALTEMSDLFMVQHETLSQIQMEGEEPLGGAELLHDGITSGRTAEGRRRGLPGRTGLTTETSELAVEAGLAWLARHQLPDGGWSFNLGDLDENHRPGECRDQCSNCGARFTGSDRRLNTSRMAATGIALLPFLGAGYTFDEISAHRQTVRAGIDFLTYRARETEYGYDFRGGNPSSGAYIQAIVALTLCEAYEMTRSRELKGFAEGAIRILVASQLDDGGWRYDLKGDSNFHSTVSGDTSVSGWVMLALKSGISAGFEIPPEVYYRANAFLDLTASDGGALYRYQPHSGESIRSMHGTSAVGLLMREYLGWTPKDAPLQRGLDYLFDWFGILDENWKLLQKGRTDRDGVELVTEDGRIKYDIYFVYYAALAMNQVGGKNWNKAFASIREFLIATQSKGENIPHESGSWLFWDLYMDDGGRLLQTAVSVLILETPYRYLPMYNTGKSSKKKTN